MPTHSPQASKRPPSSSPALKCHLSLFLAWQRTGVSVTENKDWHHPTARGLKGPYPKPHCHPDVTAPCGASCPQQRPIRELHSTRELDLNPRWCLAFTPVLLLPVLVLAIPPRQERGSSVHIVA